MHVLTVACILQLCCWSSWRFGLASEIVVAAFAAAALQLQFCMTQGERQWRALALNVAVTAHLPAVMHAVSNT